MSKSCCNEADDPNRGNESYRRVLWAVLAINAVMFAVEVAAGLAAGSASLQADALDFLGDAGNYAISLFVVGMALRYRALRAQSIRGRMALEGLYVPTNASWYPMLRSELLSFPAGKHDDQIDALGLVGQLLDQMVPGQKPKAPEKPKPDSGYRPFAFAERPNDWMFY